MNITTQGCQWIQPPPSNALEIMERAGRTCYKSEDKITEGSACDFVSRITKLGHHSVLEHVSASMLFITDRGVSHEIVRHRIASYSQESTRYANYSKNKFGKEITVIKPPFDNHHQEAEWMNAMLVAEKAYLTLVDMGVTAQIARAVLPTCLKTEIVMTANLREWMHFFKMRCDHSAHPQIQQLANMALEMFRGRVPILFDNI